MGEVLSFKRVEPSVDPEPAQTYVCRWRKSGQTWAVYGRSKAMVPQFGQWLFRTNRRL